MAQRLIHYLFGEIFAKYIEFKDKKRFLLGSVLPDAYTNRNDRDRTHYTVKADSQVYFDFGLFKEQHCDFILNDDLYLGYYMHLMEDNFYRQFVYNQRFTMPRTQDEVAILHEDYHILNSYIVGKYHLQNELDCCLDLSQESVMHIADFNVNEFLREMSSDFTENREGNAHFLTADMLEEFIDKYIPIGLKELHNIENKTFVLQAVDFAWETNRTK